MYSTKLFLCYVLFIDFLHLFDAVENITFSFRIPDQWGMLSFEDGDCCSQLTVPLNFTTEKKLFPHFIGLGVQKSGSTTLAWYLNSHPSYVISSKKEVHFFDRDYNLSSIAVYERQWRRKKARNAVRYEFTPSYLWIPFAACRVKVVLPDLKFIVILRNPADRAYSEYNMVRHRCKGRNRICVWRKLDYYEVVKKGISNLVSRNCAFNNGDGAKTWNDCYKCLTFHAVARRYCHYRPFYFKEKGNGRKCFFFGDQVVSKGLYAAQLAWWFSLFPPERFVVILSHDFYKDPAFHLNRLRDMIGLGEEYTKSMLPKEGHGVGMKGKYKYPDMNKDQAKQLLTKFFHRPNLELYKLLDSTNHGHYTPFESIPPSNHSILSNKSFEENVERTILAQKTKLISQSKWTIFNEPLVTSGFIFYALLSALIAAVVVWHLLTFQDRRRPL